MSRVRFPQRRYAVVSGATGISALGELFDPDVPVFTEGAGTAGSPPLDRAGATGWVFRVGSVFRAGAGGESLTGDGREGVLGDADPEDMLVTLSSPVGCDGQSFGRRGPFPIEGMLKTALDEGSGTSGPASWGYAGPGHDRVATHPMIGSGQ